MADNNIEDKDVNDNSVSDNDVIDSALTQSSRETDGAGAAEPGPGFSMKVSFWRKLLRKKLFWTMVLFLLLLRYGTYKFDQLILNPPAKEWGPVALTDLQAERWYETEAGKKQTERLGEMTNKGIIKVLTGLYYRQYKQKYASGIRNTQFVKVGPDQYPDIYEMVVEACETLGSQGGEPIKVPKIYLGYTGRQALPISNYQDPSIVIGNDFLWVFKPPELQYLLARKVGNIHCKHIFFLDVVKGVRSILNSALPELLDQVLLGGIGGDLLDWLKEAEISADRAGLLVTGDVDVACNALIKLNIFASLDDFYGQANPETFARQVELLDANRLTTASAALSELKNPNPFLTIRVADLLQFYRANSKLFKDRRLRRTKEHIFDSGPDVEEILNETEKADL